MTTIRRVMPIVPLLAASVVTGFGARAEALPIFSISPVSQNGTADDSVSADRLVSRLVANESTGGALVLPLNSPFLSGTGATHEPNNKSGLTPGGPNSSGGAMGGGPVERYFIASRALENAALTAPQGAAPTLATVAFTGTANGLSTLNLTVPTSRNAFPSGADGNVLPTTVANGALVPTVENGVLPTISANGSALSTTEATVCEGGNCTVPEPALLPILAAGLTAVALRRRRQSYKAH